MEVGDESQTQGLRWASSLAFVLPRLGGAGAPATVRAAATPALLVGGLSLVLDQPWLTEPLFPHPCA